jgi:hypothetical protein
MKRLKVKAYNKGSIFPYIVADNWYAPPEEEHIWKELNFYSARPQNFERSDAKGGLVATNPDGSPRGFSSRIYLARIFQQQMRNYSHIHYYNFKQVTEQFKNFVDKTMPHGRLYGATNLDSTFVSYYEDGDKYDPHFDSSMFTLLIWFYKEPKKFKGGDLILPESNSLIKCKHNRLIMFPSYYLHQVTPIKMNKKNLHQGLGRYTITTFYWHHNTTEKEI